MCTVRYVREQHTVANSTLIYSVDPYNSRSFCHNCMLRESFKNSVSKPRFRICYGSRIYIEFCMNYLFTLHSWDILPLLKMISEKVLGN